ncbi:hypothetical protein QEZ54_21240 [Catellatospora sp. KI3]|nr:hypothetical protein [Catellatospora sp. KI3]MDI1463510.1 hypothetical protein [Catellatospora sp. KI3]
MSRIPAEFVPPWSLEPASVFDIVCLGLMLLAIVVWVLWMVTRKN